MLVKFPNVRKPQAKEYLKFDFTGKQGVASRKSKLEETIRNREYRSSLFIDTGNKGKIESEKLASGTKAELIEVNGIKLKLEKPEKLLKKCKKAIDRARLAGLDINDLQIVSGEKVNKKLGRGMTGGYIHGGKNILTKSSLSKIETKIDKLTGWCSGKDTASILIHEMVHYADYMRFERNNDSKLQKYRVCVLNDQAKKIAGKVSSYARKNRTEFIAEVGTGAIDGEKYDSKVWNMYYALKGPELANLVKFDEFGNATGKAVKEPVVRTGNSLKTLVERLCSIICLNTKRLLSYRQSMDAGKQSAMNNIG